MLYKDPKAHRERTNQLARKRYQTKKEPSRTRDEAHREVRKGQNRTKALRYYRTHTKEYKERQHARGQRLKLEVFQAYGGAVCVCCQETHLEFLSIDHIGGGGAIHRRTLGKNRSLGNRLYGWLKAEHYPSGYRVLCMNCNFALGKYGYCPHSKLAIAPAFPPYSNGSFDQLSLF